MTIPFEEIKFHPMSFMDPNGRIFRWQGGLYRGISDSRSGLYRELFQKGLVQKWITQGLIVETELTELQAGDYNLVLKHRELPFVSFAFEWSSQMLKDAALLVINLELELEQHNLTLQDGHPWNVLFDGARPLFIDFGSIKPSDSKWGLWGPYDEFCRYFLYPLELFAAGHGRIARALLFEWDRGVEAAECEALVNYSKPATPEPPPKQEIPKSRWQSFFRNRPAPEHATIPEKINVPDKTAIAPDIKSFSSRRELLEALKRQIEAIELPWQKTAWSNYYDTLFPPFSPANDWNPKHQNVHRILCELKPNTIADAGSNRGWYAQMAATLGSKVVGFDVDEACVSRLYNDVTINQLSVLPLVISFLKPSPAYGLNHWFPSASDRFKSELVMALALTHHLVFRSPNRLNFEQIVAGLDAFSKRWLLIEFIPKEDKYVSEWWTPEYSWYTQENLEAVLRKYYKSIRVFPSFHPPRVMLLCEK